MAILEAGTFNVNDHRKSIPAAVKLAVMIRQQCRDLDGQPFTIEQALTGKINFDHNPALTNRPFNTFLGDFIPPQNDPDKIEARRKGAHDEKTFGRKEGAEKTGSTRGSDVGERARTRDIRKKLAGHKVVMDAKRGIVAPAAEPSVLEREFAPREKRKSHFPQGRKIQSAGFQKGHRPLRSGNNLRRKP